MNHRSLILAFAASVPAIVCSQEAAKPVVGMVMRLLDTKVVMEQASKIDQKTHPDAETVLVNEHIKTEYTAEGTYTTYDEEFVKVLTEEGRRSAREKSFSYNVFYGGLEVLAVDVLKADGKVVSHDPKKISKEQVDRSQMSANIFDPNDKVLVAAIPQLEVGDVVRVFVKKWENKPRMAGNYSDWSVLESPQPIANITYEYVGPKDKPLRSKALLATLGDSVKAEETVVGDKIRYRWIGTNIPQLFPEPGMPDFYTVGQRLLVSTLADWKEVSRWYWDISKPHLEKVTPEMQAKVSSLVATASTHEEKIKAIFKFVSQEIRYMGITTETEAPGYEPHDVNITFENRYGVCRDKAALLATMLKEAGLEAFPVLIKNGTKLDQTAPSPFFNHAITAVRNPDKTYTLMDSTDENTADLLPQYLQNKSYLVATPDGETLMTSPIPPAEDNMAKVKTKVNLNDDGSATGQCTILFEGINDNVYRGHLAKQKPDDIRRLFERILKGTLAGGSLTGLKVLPENMLDTTQKLTVTMDFAVPSLVVAGGGAAQLELPYVGSGLGLVGRILGGSLGLEKRRFPLSTDIACGVEEEVVVQLPPSLKEPLALPEYSNTEHKDFTIDQKISSKDGVLTASTKLLLKAPEISPEGYLELKKAMAKLEVNGRQEPVFARENIASIPPPVADVQVISNKYHLRVEDAHTFASRQEVHKKVLTFAGKKDNSELKFDYNPAWTTIEIESAQVTQKDGTVKEIKKEEMNTLDAAWVASAPRYPGGKTLVVSLPGVEVGSEIRYVVKRTDRQQPFFQSDYAFAGYDATDALEFTYDLPADLPLRSLFDFPAKDHYTEETKDGRKILTFRWSDLKPLARETSTPPMWVDHPDFVLSAGDWASWVKVLDQEIKACLAESTAAKAKGAELAAKAGDKRAQLVAIRTYVAKEVRAVGLSFLSLPLDAALSPADVTLKDSYGHSADRAILLCALLQGAGFEAEVVLASGATTEPRFVQRALDFPESGYYGNVICRVKNPDNAAEWYPLDNLNQYAEIGTTNLDGQPGRTLTNEEFTWKAPKGLKNESLTNLAIQLDAEGNAEITVSSTFSGVNHQSLLQQYQEMTPEELSRHHQTLISSISQNAVPSSDLKTDFGYPARRTYSAKVKSFAIRTANALYFDLPSVPRSLFSTDADSRVRPWFYADESNASYTWTVTVPGGMTPQILPEKVDWTGPGTLGTVSFNCDVIPGKKETRMNASFEMHLKPALIPAGNYKDLLKMNELFNHGRVRRVLLQPQG